MNTPKENNEPRSKRSLGSKHPNESRKGRGPSKGGRHRSGGSRRRRRPLAHGDLRLLVLQIIGDTPSHGYGLINEIKNLTSGAYEPSPGVIYPALEALQDLGWVEVQPDGGKRVLHITEEGKTEITSQGEAIKTIEARLKTLAAPDLNTDPVDVRSALRQLKHTTISTVKDKPVDAEIRKDVISILAEAKLKIAGLK